MYQYCTYSFLKFQRYNFTHLPPLLWPVMTPFAPWNLRCVPETDVSAVGVPGGRATSALYMATSTVPTLPWSSFNSVLFRTLGAHLDLPLLFRMGFSSLACDARNGTQLNGSPPKAARMAPSVPDPGG